MGTRARVLRVLKTLYVIGSRHLMTYIFRRRSSVAAEFRSISWIMGIFCGRSWIDPLELVLGVRPQADPVRTRPSASCVWSTTARKMPSTPGLTSFSRIMMRAPCNL